ncbi:pyridoxamine 5'-phosphate oxidase-domain-containing protein [Dichotomopilus funicola]|uniref:Pyridoxamine 5'-phosphate oxidase-domain-containing protein n=1 Tax=Dichotomopilus funicola TaxID=1934379 RepID=A0AAN6V6T5_9PEZI|nr:pyridoxamine 5'-phosphate oxidase-domain-containing protein [Dichotomopilus funicola]
MPSSTPAPWRAPFLTHITPLPSPTFTLATLQQQTPTLPSSSSTAAADSADSADSTNSTAFPRARTCVFRGFWASLSPHPSNPAPLNPTGVFESDLLVFTTDGRSEKVGGLFSSGTRSSDVKDTGGKEETLQTGGGGQVEAVWWVDKPEVRTQWRVRGRAWVLGSDVEGGGEKAEEVRGVLRGRMRRLLPRDENGDWSFAREVTAHFGNLTPLMRGTFKGPPPGVPVACGAGDGEVLAQRVEGVEDEAARRNFRVVVIVPEEVDQVDLSEELKPRRWLYVYRGEDGKARLPGGEVIGEWEKVEVWP